MRKLIHVLTILLFSIGAFANGEATFINPTYSVEAEGFPTNFGNYFAYYHVNLELSDLTRVAKNGNLRIVVNYEKGMEVSETRFEKKPNGAIYYITDFVRPTYRATIYDSADKVLLEKNYGGDSTFVEYGKDQNYPEGVLATKWLNEKDNYFQQLEFKNLDFDDLEEDIIDLLDEIPVSDLVVKSAVAKKTRSRKEPRLSSPRTPTRTAEEQQVVDETAAVKEEELLSDPFPEVDDEPITGDRTAEMPAPPTPTNFDEPVKESMVEETAEPTRMEQPADKSTDITPVLSDRKNIVKLNLPNLAFGNITLNYERILSPRNTAVLNVGYIRPQALSSFLADDSWSGDKFSGITATAEYRFYSKKKGAPRGFYYAPYLRYANYKLDYRGSIDENDTNVVNKISTIGLGGQIGIQWLIKDRVSIDWGILGLAVQRYNFSSTFTAANADEAINFEEILAEIQQEIDDSPLNNKLKFETGDDFLKTKMPFLFGGARAYLSVGYSF